MKYIIPLRLKQYFGREKTTIQKFIPATRFELGTVNFTVISFGAND